jgi:hypothetical protein
MSVLQNTLVWQRQCEPRRQHLLHAIADCADDEGRAFPSVNYLVWKTGLPRSTVLLYLQEFRKSGVLQDLGRRSQIDHRIIPFSPRDTSVFMLHVERIPAKEPWRGRPPSPAIGLGVVQPMHRASPAVRGASPVTGLAIRKETSFEPSGETGARARISFPQEELPGSPDPNCKKCGGTGRYESTAHPGEPYVCSWCVRKGHTA